MYDFIAIDFETANNNLNSACSIGIVAVKDLQIVNREHYYIKPPIDSGIFNNKNIDIHGITPDLVADKPYFNEIWDKIKHYFNEDEIIIAHNPRFDMSVLKNCLNTYQLAHPDFIYMDSISISTKACGNTVGRKLDDRANFFNINIDNHHDALCDAEVAAKIVISTVLYKKRKSFTAFCNVHNGIGRKSFSELKPDTYFGSSKSPSRFTSINISEIAATTDAINTNSPFFEKSCVFTGDLKTLGRKEAMQKVVNLGGIIKSAVSKKTDYLIVGTQDIELVGEDGLSTKEEKAYALNNDGCNIRIIKEDEFLEMLNR
jgi:DNA polymerase-3 subunit epsilon